MSATASATTRRRLVPPRAARVVVAIALGLSLAGGVTGAALGAVGSASSDKPVVEHGGHGLRGGEEPGRIDPREQDRLPAPVAPQPPGGH